MMMEAYTEYPGMEYKIYGENQGEGLGSKGSERKYFLCLCYHSLLPAPSVHYLTQRPLLIIVNHSSLQPYSRDVDKERINRLFY